MGLKAQGILSQMLQWTTHPLNDEGTLLDYGAGMILIFIFSFAWYMVVKDIANA